MNQRELVEIIGSWLVLSVAFAWILQDPSQGNTVAERFLPSLVIALVAVGTGFVLHELAHKYVSIHYGVHAEFFAWPVGLGIALLLALTLGIIFAAPGAVYIFAERLSKKQNGIISIAGPLTNITLGILCFGLLQFFPTDFLRTLFSSALQINFWLAFFNLIPFGPLDGTKVFNWNKPIWIASILIAFLGPAMLYLLKPW